MNPDKLKNFIAEHQEDFNQEAPPAGLWDRIETAITNEDEGSDPLREFIVIHREEFDNATPPPQIFQAVADAALPEKRAPASAPKPLKVSHRRRYLGYLMGIAASLLLLFVAYNFGNKAGYRAGQSEHVAQQIDRIDPELASIERFYQQKIDAEFTKVNQVNDDPQLRRDLKEIDAATNEIRAQLLEVPVSQRQVLVNELIDAYRTKLDILLRIQQHFSRPLNLPGDAAPTPADRHNIKTNES